MIVPNKLALGIDPNSPLSVTDMVECAQLAERKGFAATWVAEGRRGEVFSLLSALAMRTSRIRLGAGVLPILVRSPWVVAMGLRRLTKSQAVGSCWAWAPAIRA